MILLNRLAITHHHHNYRNMTYKHLMMIRTADCSYLRNYSNTNASISVKEQQDNTKNELQLPKENAFPTHFVKSRGIGRPVYALVPGPNGELLADYVLFEETMKRQKLPWICYNKMTSEERTIYIKHYKALEARKLLYKCPITGNIVKTESQLIFNGKCCGEGCRHCPYELEACDAATRKSLVWNGAYYT